MVAMGKEEDTHAREPQNNPPRLRLTRSRVLWLLAPVVALLVVRLGIGLLKLVNVGNIADRTVHITTLIGIGVAAAVIFILLVLGGASLDWTGLS